MRYGLGALGLALLVAGAAVCRSARVEVRERPSVGPPALSGPPVSSPVPLEPAVARPAGDRALRLVHLLGELEKSSGSRPASDLLTVLQGDEARLTGELKALLKTEPQAWRDLTELLCCLDDVPASLKLVHRVREDMDAEAEGLAIEILRSGIYPGARQVAVGLLQGRESTESRAALISAALEDTDRVVRHAALLALAQRKERGTGSDGAVAIDEAIRRLARTEPDLEVRTVALRLSGEAIPGEVSPPPPPRSARFRSLPVAKTAEPQPPSPK